MRAVNIFAALSGVLALVMLVAASHPLKGALEPAALDRIILAAFIQLSAACAGLALSNRAGRLNLIAAALILCGAALFACVLYALSLAHAPWLAILAPVGGSTLIAGWIVLVFAKPRT
jgi:uncharacterized membrane protein YgdD (TMEM256/DUF423 family)